MNRRTFVRNSVAGSVGLAGVNAPAVFARGKGTAVAETIPNPPPAFELDEMTVIDLQNAMMAGKYTARSLAKKYLDRIDDVVQETLTTVHRARQTYDPSRSFAAWLRTIAQRRSIDGLRHHGRHTILRTGKRRHSGTLREARGARVGIDGQYVHRIR